MLVFPERDADGKVRGLEAGMARGGEAARKRLDERLGAIAGKEGRELPSLAVLVARLDGIEYEGYFGRRYIDPADPSKDQPVDGRTKFRIASISKPAVCICAMTLAEEGNFDLDRDLSDYLGFRLRNPSFPDRPISAAMLLSHTSSIRDDAGYALALGDRLDELLLPGGRLYAEGKAFASPVAGRDAGPGAFYRYSNLNYGILATAIERITGIRFDLLAKERVLAPLGLDAGYNVLHISGEGFGHIAALYRKGDDEGHWDPTGPWVAQVDDFRGVKPALACRRAEGMGPAELERYVPGVNGAFFSPQGGLRISARDLSKVMRLLMNGGEVDGTRLLKPDSVRLMTTPRWRWESSISNGELESGQTRETGLGLAHGTDSWDEFGGDRLLPGGGPRMWGHHGDAYGFLGGMRFDPEAGYGYIYLCGGSAVDPVKNKGRHSSCAIWEEEIQEAILEELPI